eukprot:GFYU01000610.1.p1 GENE.GFYU01000610.1~~GFYU01000610.1.p1  ORF type:complete len:291 (+),score=106.46 GFYU01000610.1:99-971(+)
MAFFFQGGMNPMNPQGPFQNQYKCFPVSFLAAQQQRDVSTLENSDKIIMPPSALDLLARLAISYPMLFELSFAGCPEKKMHCGVLEFIAEEGIVYLPYWMMQNLNVEEGHIITVKSATIPKGKFVKFRPQSSDFFKISNPKAVLESALRGYSAMTEGETFRISYNKREFDIDVVEVRPEGISKAISIIETDVEVDFEEPKEDQTKPMPIANPSCVYESSDESGEELHSDEEDKFKAFKGSGARLDGKAATARQMSRASLGGGQSLGSTSGTADEEKKEFKAFGGQGYSLK